MPPLVALAVQILVLGLGFAGLSWGVVLIISVSLSVYFLAWAPADCRAINRGGSLCRNNAKGMLGACHLQQHRQQKAWRRVAQIGPRNWLAETLRGSGQTIRQAIDTLGSVASVVSAVVALVAFAATR